MPRTLAKLPGYDILGRLGRGAGAVIYEARDRSDSRRVAIKHVTRNSPEDDRYIEQAETEFNTASKFDNPYLRKYYDIVRVRQWFKIRELFLIMELVDGVRMDEQKPEKLDDILEIFIHVAQGLQAMHQYGYVHADIKPNNIMLLPNRGVKLIDFGQSCTLGATKKRIQGTPDYIAPEQVSRSPLDQRTDVFNLGATMYWVTTGKAFTTQISVAPPGAKKLEVDARRGSEPPHEFNPDIPLPLSRLIMECCETAMNARPWDMNKVISRLEVVQHLQQKQRAAKGAGAE